MVPLKYAGENEPVETKVPGWASGRRAPELVPVVTRNGGAQSVEAEMLQGTLPSEKFFGGQFVTLTCRIEAEQSTAHGGNDLRFFARHPPPGVGSGQIVQCENVTSGPVT